MSKTTDHIIKERNENPIPFEGSYLEEINDYYETKNRIGDLIIEHHYGFNKENKTNSEKVKELYFKVFAELDKYREKHGKKNE